MAAPVPGTSGSSPSKTPRKGILQGAPRMFASGGGRLTREVVTSGSHAGDSGCIRSMKLSMTDEMD